MTRSFSRRQFGLLGAALAGAARAGTEASSQAQIEAWLPVVAAGQGPAARWDHTLAADDANKRLLIFGGRDQNGAAFGDLWLFDRAAEAWSAIDASGPESRFGHAVATDQDAGTMYLFGGQSANTFYNDLWALDLASTSWQRIYDGDSAPSPRYGTSLVLAPGGRLIVSHGFTFEGRFDDTWAYEIDSERWIELTPPNQSERPLKRCLHEAVWSARSNRMLLYGGCSSGFGPCPQGDLWEFDLDDGTWIEREYPNQPPARSNPGLVYDAPRDQILLVGGLTDGGSDDGLFVLSPVSGDEPAWSEPPLSPGPSPRSSHDIAVTGPRLYMFGGNSDLGVLGDLWTLDVRKLSQANAYR